MVAAHDEAPSPSAPQHRSRPKHALAPARRAMRAGWGEPRAVALRRCGGRDGGAGPGPERGVAARPCLLALGGEYDPAVSHGQVLGQAAGRGGGHARGELRGAAYALRTPRARPHPRAARLLC
eukprot:scaffold96977_cov33-Phaeocystis_antarctica.AAC.2